MKINTPCCINQNSVLSHKNTNSNISFGEELTDVNIVSKSDKSLKVDIFDKRYCFKLVDEAKDPNVLDSMIENIKKSMTGYFIRSGKHEYYAPYILLKAPNILSQRRIVERGNAKTEINEESKAALEVIQSQANKKFNIKNLKTIKYLRRPFDGYANNTIAKAFGYLDKSSDDLYLYIPQKNKMKILINDCFVKKIKL